MASARRGLVYAVFGGLCVYLLLPFQTSIPGLSTFTILKAGAALLLLTALASAVPKTRERWRAAAAGWLLPFVALAVWCPVAALSHASWSLLDSKMFLSLGAGVALAMVLDQELAAVRVRNAVVRMILWGGVIAAVSAVLEPLTTPSWDGLWRWFRPNLPVFNPVTGDVDQLRWIHWNVGGLFRVSGIEDSPNGLAALLALWTPLAGAAWLLPGRRGAGLVVVGAVALVFAATMTRSLVLATAAGSGCVVTWLWATRIWGEVRRGRWELVREGMVLVAGLAAVGIMGLHGGGESTFQVTLFGLVGLMAVGVLWNRGQRLKGRGIKDVAPVWPAQWLTSGVMLVAILALPFVLPLLGARFSQSVEQASAERRQLWGAAVHLIRVDPLMGPGYHRYYDAIQHDPVFRVPSLIGDFGRAVDNPHNLYLTAAVSGGIPALGFLLAAGVVLLRLAGRRMLDQRASSATRGLAGALLAYWIGFFLSGLVGRNIFIVNESLAWHAVAALTAASCLARKSS